jgi:hypothetical protein
MTAPSARAAAPMIKAVLMPSAKAREATSASMGPVGPPMSPAARMAAPIWSWIAVACSDDTGKPLMASLTRGPYVELMTEPRAATLRAPPTWRVVSLTAEPTPALASGSEPMIHSVAEGITNAMPAASTTSGWLEPRMAGDAVTAQLLAPRALWAAVVGAVAPIVVVGVRVVANL